MQAERRAFGIEFEFGLRKHLRKRLRNGLWDGPYSSDYVTNEEVQRLLSFAMAENPADVFRGWAASEDCGGAEFKTPKCTQADWPRISQALTWLTNAGAHTGSAWGTHFHIDLRRASHHQKNYLATFWLLVEEAVFALIPQSRLETGWCDPCALSFDDAHLTLRQTWKEARNQALKHGVELWELQSKGAAHFSHFNTLEIRMPPCTLDFDVIRRWVVLGQAVVNQGLAITSKKQLAELGRLDSQTLLRHTVSEQLQAPTRHLVLPWLGC